MLRCSRSRPGRTCKHSHKQQTPHSNLLTPPCSTSARPWNLHANSPAKPAHQVLHLRPFSLPSAAKGCPAPLPDHLHPTHSLTSTGSLRSSLSPTSQKKPADAMAALISADHWDAGNRLLQDTQTTGQHTLVVAGTLTCMHCSVPPRTAASQSTGQTLLGPLLQQTWYKRKGQ
jgi:hypothetical protein